MSSQAVAWAIVMQAGGPSAKAVLMSVANYADAYGECWQDQATLAEGAELGERQFRTILKNLIERGLIARERRGGEGHGRKPDLLRLRMREMPAMITAKRRPEPDEQPAISSNRQSLPEAKQPEKIAERATGNIQHGNRQLIAGTVDNPTKSPTTPYSPPGFDDAWMAWPQRGRSSKAKANELWRRALRQHDPAILNAAVSAYLASPDARKEAGAFVPALERWLRDKLDSWIELGVRERPPDEQAERVRVYAETGRWNPTWGAKP